MGFFIAQILGGLGNAAALFLVAAGLSLIFGVTRVVNFAHGSLYMLGAYFAYFIVLAMENAGFDGIFGFWFSVLVAAIGVAIVGLVIEVLVLRPVYRAPELFQLVATFGVILVIQDLALMVFGPEDLLGPRAPGLKGIIRIGDGIVTEYDVALIVVALLVLVGLGLLMQRTRIGVLVRAATQDREMVGALGVNQSWLFTGIFMLGSALAGLGGALQLPKGGADLLMDFNILAAIFVVVVIGGMGSIKGAFVAAAIISVVNIFGVRYLPSSTLVLMFVVMAIILITRPYGLFGREERPGEHGQQGSPQRPIRPAGTTGKLLWGLLLVALAVLPALGDRYLLVLMIDIVVLSLFAASLHFILSTGGLVSFGHAAFYGGGVYAGALLVTYAQAPMELALLLAPLLAGLLAIIIGWFCIRLTGVYFAMLTLAFSQLLWSIAFQWTEVTRGDDGLLNIWPSDWASSTFVYYYLVLVLGAGGIILLRHVTHSPFGYALRGTRDSELRAEATGINARHVRWAAFTFAGMMAGLAGALFVFSKGSAFPTELEIARSFDAIIMVFFGGVQNLSGPFVGAGAFTLLEDWLSRFEYWRLCLGLAIIAVVVIAPEGIAGGLERLAMRLGLRGREERA